MISEHRVVIPALHPSLPGHFPDHPVTPGVVILEEVLQAFMTRQPQMTITGFPVVKFLAPVLPEQAFTIRFEPTRNGTIGFSCARDDGSVVAQGRLTTAAHR